MSSEGLLNSFIRPEWPAPARVQAFTTTRLGGFSQAPFDSFNLARHVADQRDAVSANREKLAACLNLESKRFRWLNQIHGTTVVEAENRDSGQDIVCDADGCTTTAANVVCLVMTADCLPVLLCDQQGTRVAAVHAGWRGLADGILRNSVEKFEDSSRVIAWLGPAIGPERFEVGEDVRERFLEASPEYAEAFKSRKDAQGKYLADLYMLARRQLAFLGVSQVFGGGFCTYDDARRFYSYRRDGLNSGRMASMIYLND